MNKFFKHVLFNIVAAALCISVNTQCMLNEETPSLIDSLLIDQKQTSLLVDQNATFINLNNPTEVKKALVDSAQNLVKKDMLVGLSLFRDIVHKKEGYREAEEVCIHNFSNNTPVVKIAILDLLEALNDHGQAIETSLTLATKALTDNDTDLKESASILLHELIIHKEVSSIPQETIEAVMLELNHEKEDIKVASSNIMKMIFKKCRPTNSSDSEEVSENGIERV